MEHVKDKDHRVDVDRGRPALQEEPQRGQGLQRRCGSENATNHREAIVHRESMDQDYVDCGKTCFRGRTWSLGGLELGRMRIFVRALKHLLLLDCEVAMGLVGFWKVPQHLWNLCVVL
jgi:hypothetical protein